MVSDTQHSLLICTNRTEPTGKNDPDGYAHSASFTVEPSGEGFIDVRVPFSELRCVRRARTVRRDDDGDGGGGDAAMQMLDTGRIASLQLMNSKFEYDGEINPCWRPGFFSLDIASIRGYSP